MTTYAESQPRRSLAGHISIRVAVVALAMSLVQLLVVIGTHRIDYDDLALDHLRREAEWSSRGIKPVAGGLVFELPGNMSHYVTDIRTATRFGKVELTGIVKLPEPKGRAHSHGTFASRETRTSTSARFERRVGRNCSPRMR